MVTFKLWIIFYLFDVIQGLIVWPRNSIASSIHHAHQKLSSQEVKTDNHKKSIEVLTINNFFTKFTPSEDAGGKEGAKKPTADTYDYRNLVLTTAINLFPKKMYAVDFNITQNNHITENVKRTIIEPKNFQKKHRSFKHFKKSKDSSLGRSESYSQEISTDEKQYRVHTPGRRIYRGHKTKIKHFPFLVTVHVLGRFICGGSIIKSDLVITAASCLKRWQEWLYRSTTTQETTNYETTTDASTTDMTTTDINTVEVAEINVTTTDATPFGNETTTDTDATATATTTETVIDSSEDSDMSSSYETTVPKTTVPVETPEVNAFGALYVRIGTNYYRLEGKVVNVVDVYFHPSYQEIYLHNNLVILRLERHLNFKRRRVRKIDIGTTGDDVPEGAVVTIAGWGAKTYHNKVFNVLWNLIHKAVLTVSSWDQCVETYTEKFVTTANFCALNEDHEGACNRDAGNPAVANGLLVGVVSFGSPECGGRDAPTVFTNLGYYTDWINDIMTMDQIFSSSLSSEEKEVTTTEHPTETTIHTSSTSSINYGSRIYPDELDIFPWRRVFHGVKLDPRFSTKEFNLKEISDIEKHRGTVDLKLAGSSGTDPTYTNNFILTPNTPKQTMMMSPHSPRRPPGGARHESGRAEAARVLAIHTLELTHLNPTSTARWA